MASSIVIDSAELAGLAIEGPLYGIFLCLFVVCSYDLYNRRLRNETVLSWPMLLAGTSLIVLSTARFIVDVTYIFSAFIHHDPRSSRIAFMQDVTRPLFITKHGIFITSVLIGDLFVNYRCWVIWNKKLWVVAFPVLLAIGAAASGYYSLWAYTHLTDQSIFAQRRSLKILFSLSLVANALATSLLACRIWWMDRTGLRKMNVAADSGSRVHPIVRIVLESGLLNAAFLFAFLIILTSGSASLETMSEMGTPMCGLIFSIVIFRVGMQHNNSDGVFPSRSWPSNDRGTRSRRNTVGINGLAADGPQPVSGTALRVFVREDTTTRQDVYDTYKKDSTFSNV